VAARLAFAALIQEDSLVDSTLDISDSGAPAPYTHLGERAVGFVQDKGGSVTEESLIAFVFGTSGPPSLWQPLLRQVLASEDRLLIRPDGRWSLIRPILSAPTGALSSFVAIDVETTGLHPLSQRIIEIALVRFTDGDVSDRFSTLVNPDKKIPKFISTLTSITNESVEESPRFAEIAGTVESFLESALLIGHNVGFDINFINAELGRAGRPQLINERLDTMGLASRLVPGLRRPSLDKVAIHLGFAPRKIHRAELDAELTGNVALQLAARAKDLGIDSVDRLRAIGRPAQNAPADNVNRGRSLLDRSILTEIPKCPGVYLMHDVNDRIIYIGKAKNLRDRVSSYFSQPLGYTRKMDGLLESIARIETVETGSELAALLLESQLIRRYQPRYNVVMRASEEYPYIRVELANAWPRITLVKTRKADGSVYFGPFRSRKAAGIAIELVNDNYPLRTCSRSFKNAKSYGSPCIQLDLGKCAGPCVGRADRDLYMSHVREAVSFFDGEDETLINRLHSQLEESAEKLDYERARKLRNSIQLLHNLVGAHRQLKEANDNNTLLLVQPGRTSNSRDVMLVIQGRLWSVSTEHSGSKAEVLTQRLRTAWNRFKATGLPVLDHHALDDVTILNRWITRNDGIPAIIRFDHRNDRIDWNVLSERALAPADVIFAAVPVEDSLIEETQSDELKGVETDILISMVAASSSDDVEISSSFA